MIAQTTSLFHRILRRSYLVGLVLVLVMSLFSFAAEDVSAADFEMRTGNYEGSGVSGLEITGLGFTPDFVKIKAATTAGVAVFKTSAMPAANTGFYSATADNTATNITLLSDGFSVGTLANVNTLGIMYFWTAVGGSDCTATGNFCVGTYTGNGAASRAITTGFQPEFVVVKRDTAVAAHFRTASMPANRTEYFVNTAANTTGAFIASFAATTFTVGATDNVNAGVYNFVAFGGAAVAEGTYTGNGVDERNITGIGIDPEYLVVKNSSSTTANNRRAYFSVRENFGEGAQGIGDTLGTATNLVNGLITDGFVLGTSVNGNQSGSTFYWFAIGGTAAPSGSGSFTTEQGSYTGTGSSFSVTGLGFAPDLVIIKGAGTQAAVFRTRVMPGDTTHYLALTTGAFTGGITALGTDGFTLGTSALVNTSSVTYYWQAFGNAYNNLTHSGASDFAVGTFLGNAIAGRDITELPFQPDFVANKPDTTVVGVYRTSLHGTSASPFSASADATGIITALNSDGFEVGNNTAVNGNAVIQYWFAFDDGPNFQVGSYTGDGTNDRLIPITSTRPDLVWVKRSTAVAPVMRPETISGDATLGFLGVVPAANQIKLLNGGGFTVGTLTNVNAAAGSYIYMAWREAPTGSLSTQIVDSLGAPIASPSRALNSAQYSFDCTTSTGVLATTAQRIRVSNQTAQAGWTMSIAATDGPTAVLENGGATQFIDFNDPNGVPAGCQDGADGDTYVGRLEIETATAQVDPQPSCASTNVALGSTQAFSQSVTDTITLLVASTGADTECYWDITDLDVNQTIPAEQLTDTYSINLTISTVAS